VGPIKWGVGKLVANAERTPLVVPIYHTGTNDIMPQSRDNELIASLPVWRGVEITIQPGDPVPVSDLIANYHHHARLRALDRNRRREAELARRRQWGGSSSAAAASAAAADGAAPGAAAAAWSWWQPWTWWSSGPRDAGVGPGKPSPLSTPPSGPLPVALPPPQPAGLRLEPTNTVEAAADHTGASAHVAGITVPVSAAQLQQEAAMRASGGADDMDAELVALWAAKARELASAASNMAAEVAAEVGVVAEEVKQEAAAAMSQATHRAADIRARAAELIDRLRRTGTSTDAGGADVKPSEAATPSTPAHNANPPDPLTPSERWRSSVSVPEPPRKVLSPTAPQQAEASVSADAPAPPATPSPVPVPAAAAVASGPRRIPTAKAEDGLAVTLSEAPVVEVVPTRTLRTGAVVPQFIDAPLRIKPPDHEYLTPAEAAAEEAIRLQLYSDIATRIHDCLAVLERQVFARRRARGVVERRPLETYSLPTGPNDEVQAADTAAATALLRERIAAWGAANTPLQ